jgi:hypothetical protein
MFVFLRFARIELGGVHVVTAAQVGLPYSGPFLLRATLLRLVLSPSLPRPKTSPPTRGFPPRTPPTGEGWGLGFFVKGDTPKTISRAQKKDHEDYITYH